MAGKRWTKEEDKILIENKDLSLQELAEQLGRSYMAIRMRRQVLKLTKNPLPTNTVKYSCNEKFFNRPTYLSCYWAGFIAADGCVIERQGQDRLSIKLSNKDRQHLELFAQQINFNGPVRKETSNGSLMAVLQITSNKICSKLNDNFNITPRKTFTLQPPSALSKNLSLAYIKGFIDGDGCIRQSKSHGLIIEFTNASYNILQWIKATLQLTQSIIKHKNANCYSLRISGKVAKQVFQQLKNIQTPELSRKW